MKIAVTNFLVVQVAIWTLFFWGNIFDSKNDITQIADTWEVVKVSDGINKKKNDDIVLHYPTFNKLTLNVDGSYVRLTNSGDLEQGDWKIDKRNNVLTLSNNFLSENYDIIQLPEGKKNLFIIKEKRNKEEVNQQYEYRLARV